MSATPPASVPRHIAIIMDGNGRWAQQRGWPRIKGHEAGAESVQAVVRACRDAGVEYLTLYAFSVENWRRPREEISGLMRLLERFLDRNEGDLHENEIRLRVIGRLQDLPKLIQRRLARTSQATAGYHRGNLILALSYGGRAELVDAMRGIAGKVAAGELKPDAIDEATVAAHLYAPDVPDPDLMVRTSGELRLSNFLLWQLSYAEWYVTDVLWPDFREANLQAAIEAYGQRQRRYGAVS